VAEGCDRRGEVIVSLFDHESEDPGRPEDAASFDVLGDDGVVRGYARQDFDQIFTSTDPDEVRRQVAMGWVVLDEREVDGPGRGPSSEDLLPGIEGLRVSGALDYESSEPVTRYVVGYLKDAVVGQPD
jgi:hypothetical protein